MRRARAAKKVAHRLTSRSTGRGSAGLLLRTWMISQLSPRRLTPALGIAATLHLISGGILSVNFETASHGSFKEDVLESCA
jgi:hypothetical protein